MRHLIALLVVISFFLTRQAIAQDSSRTVISTNNADQIIELAQLGNLEGWQGHPRGIYGVAWSPDGTKLATGLIDGTVRVWNANSTREIAVLKGHTDYVIAVDWSPDGTMLASASYDGKVIIWNMVDYKPIGFVTDEFDGTNVAWAPNGTSLAYGAIGNAVQVVDSEQLSLIFSLWSVHDSRVNNVTWSPDGMSFASASLDGVVKFWDATTGQELTMLEPPNNDVFHIYTADWSPDGTMLAFVYNEYNWRLIDSDLNEETAVFEGHTSWVWDVDWSPDGTIIASASEDMTVRLWDVQEGTEIAILNGHTKWVNTVAWSPDGTKLASASWDGTVRIWGIPK